MAILHIDVTEQVKAWIRGEGGSDLAFLLSQDDPGIEELDRDTLLFTEEQPEVEFRPRLEVWDDLTVPTPYLSPTMTPTPTLSSTITPTLTPTATSTPVPEHWTYHAYRQGVDDYTGSFFIQLHSDKPLYHQSKSDYGWIHAPFDGGKILPTTVTDRVIYGPTLIGFQNIQISNYYPQVKRAVLTLTLETISQHPLQETNSYQLNLIRRAVHFDRSSTLVSSGINLTTYRYASYPDIPWSFPGTYHTSDIQINFTSSDDIHAGESFAFLHFDVTALVQAWLRGEGGPELVFRLVQHQASVEDLSRDARLYTEEIPILEFRPKLEIWEDITIPTPSLTPTLTPTWTPTIRHTPVIVPAVLCGSGEGAAPPVTRLRSPNGSYLLAIKIPLSSGRWVMTTGANSGGIADNFIFGVGPYVHQSPWEQNHGDVLCYYASSTAPNFYYLGQRNAPFPWICETGGRVPRIESNAAEPTMPPGRPYNINPSDEVRVAAGNVLNDARDEVLVAQGCFAQSRFRIVEFVLWGPSITSVNTTFRPLELGNPPGGINLGTADVDRDGYDEIIAAQVGEPYNEFPFHFGSTIQAINITNPETIDTATITGENIQRSRIFPVFGEFTNPSSALRVAGGDIDGDGLDEVVVTSASMDLHDGYGPMKLVPGGNRIIILRPDFSNDNFQNGWFTVANDASGNPISFQLFNESQNPTGDIRISIGNLDETPAEEIVIGYGTGTNGDVFIYRFDATKNGQETLVELNHFQNGTNGVYPAAVHMAK